MGGGPHVREGGEVHGQRGCLRRRVSHSFISCPMLFVFPTHILCVLNVPVLYTYVNISRHPCWDFVLLDGVFDVGGGGAYVREGDEVHGQRGYLRRRVSH